MSKQFLKFNNVSFGYEVSPVNIFNYISFSLAVGWTGLIGPNGSGKTTLLKLACRILNPTTGSIEAPINTFYNEQRTDNPPSNFAELLGGNDKSSFQLVNSLGIQPIWLERWSTLSYGERKRAQIACALFSCPDLLAVDEPTNHLDMETKLLIADSMKSFKGIGLIVSHDRDLMADLCSQFIFIDSVGMDFRKGKLSEVIEQRKTENEHNLKKLEIKENEYGRLKKEYNRRSELTEKSKRKFSKRNIDINDRDAKGRIDLARLTGRDAVAGNLKKRMQNRLENLQSDIENIEVKREYRKGIILSGSYSKRNYLLNLEPGGLELSVDKKLLYNNLVISPRDRIALTGENGSGKSTLIRHLLKHINAEPERITYIPQEISVDETKKLIGQIQSLKNEQLGKLLIIVSRLGSDAKRILNTDIPSPGETRKLLLGLGIAADPHIIIMDEPTNHMDLVSIECLEDALQNVSCALLLVSHDRRFLQSTTGINWKIIKREREFELLA